MVLASMRQCNSCHARTDMHTLHTSEGPVESERLEIEIISSQLFNCTMNYVAGAYISSWATTYETDSG